MADGTAHSTLNVLSKNYLSAAQYKVRLIANAANGCADTFFRLATVLPVPAPQFTVNKQVQCLTNQSFVFSNTTNTNGATGVSYQWILQGSGLYMQKDIPAITFPDTGRYRVSMNAGSAFGCKDSQVMFIYVAENPTISISANQPVCQGLPVNFKAQASVKSGNILGYVWDFGDGAGSAQQNAIHTYSASGNFQARCTASSTNGCSTTSGPISMTIFPKPKADFNWEQTDSRGMETDHRFVFTGSGASLYSWLFYDGSTNQIPGPVLKTFSDTGWRWVSLTVVSTDGCRDSLTRRILLKPQLQMWIPTSFTPNEDGKNDIFKPSTAFGLSKYRMLIYNRWGEMIYQTTDPKAGWNAQQTSGKEVPEGVYAYEISFRYIDGHLYVYKGTVTLLR